MASSKGTYPQYCSTRGGMKDASFEHVVMSGLAPGGGLFVPQFVPKLSAADLEQMRPMSFQELAFALMRCALCSQGLSLLMKRRTHVLVARACVLSSPHGSKGGS
jgi:threonine synthase